MSFTLLTWVEKAVHCRLAQLPTVVRVMYFLEIHMKPWYLMGWYFGHKDLSACRKSVLEVRPLNVTPGEAA